MTKRRIPENTASYSRWLAAQLERRNTIIRLNPSTSLFVAMALEGYAHWLDKCEADEIEMIVTVEDGHGRSRVVASARHPTIATAAFTSATMVHPKEHVRLRHGLRLMCERPAVAVDEAITKDETAPDQ